MSALLASLMLLIGTDVVTVGNDAALRAALREARPGLTIRLQPGMYRGGLWLETSGTQQQPIVIEAADAENPPHIEGGSEGIHLAGCAYVTLRNLHFRGQQHNGVNADDAGRMDGAARGIVLEGLVVTDLNPEGNHDGIKLSGLEDFRVAGCTINGWGGSGIDLVGCHEGVIEGCLLRGSAQIGSGIQIKGGSSRINVRRCDFIDAGQRALNLGGSTGLAYFRPPDATAEARNLVVEHCRFVGSLAPVAFVGSEDVVVRHNTFLNPERWIIRILQETTGQRFVPCRGGIFERNMIVFRSAQLQSHHLNIGPGTEPATFNFSENFWYCSDAPERSRPDLPMVERRGIYGQDPQMVVDERGLPVVPADSPGLGFGAAQKD